MFGAKCNSCNKSLQANDLVMRTSFGKIFHSNCFKCSICDRNLKKGDEYLINENAIFCKYDYELARTKNNITSLLPISSPTSTSPKLLQHNNSFSINDQDNNDFNHHTNQSQLVNNSNSSFNSNPSKSFFFIICYNYYNY